KKKDGEVVHVSITVRTIFAKDGTPIGTEGIMRNINERKRVEERIVQMNAELEQRVIERTAEIEQTNQYLSALLDTSIILNKNLDLEDLLDRILLQARKIIPCRAINLMLIEGEYAYIARRQGYKGLEEIERNLVNFKFPLEWPTFNQMLKTGESIYIRDTFTEPGWQKVPNSEWVRAYIGTPLSVGKNIIGFLNFSHDQPDFFTEKDTQLLKAFANHASIAIQNSRLLGEITASLAKEKNLRDRLVQADKLAALGKMVAVIAHEINNPIQTVKNSFYLLENEIPSDSMGREYLKIASAEANRISNLVLQLREAYRPRSKRFEPVNIPDLIREVHVLLTPQLKKSQVVYMQNDATQPYVVRGIRDNLKQVFINLSMNAVEALSAHEGGIIKVDYVIPDDKTVGVVVNNNGPLISPDALSSIFDPFFTTKESGSGLGLSIAFDIVKQHAGEITVDNDPDRGVTFTVWLPLADKNQSE
ncbi:MAG: GAF domain-containing protein, partial [Chloroflexi bacterium]